jgi:hypothetical protein
MTKSVGLTELMSRANAVVREKGGGKIILGSTSRTLKVRKDGNTTVVAKLTNDQVIKLQDAMIQRMQRDLLTRYPGRDPGVSIGRSAPVHLEGGRTTKARANGFTEDLKSFTAYLLRNNHTMSDRDIAKNVCNGEKDSPALLWKYGKPELIPRAGRCWNAKNKDGDLRSVDSVARAIGKLRAEVEQPIHARDC